VKNKNIRLLLGKPMIAHTIEQARATGLFDAIAVSSDSPEILEISMKYGATHAVVRPQELATDQAPKLPAIQHCVAETEKLLGGKCDISVDLDASSPVRTSEDIIACVNLLQKKKADNVITGVRSRKSPYFNMVEAKNDGTVGLVKAPAGDVVRRQDVPVTYDMNASIYVWRREALMEGKSIFASKTYLHEMNEESAYDIDSEIDFKIVEMILRREN
jgi:N-acylneuraminate cytidylyltransferase/CMP-N,N'-diacetyllegionaminic acid synthase